jgi:hypothetical protein
VYGILIYMKKIVRNGARFLDTGVEYTARILRRGYALVPISARPYVDNIFSLRGLAVALFYQTVLRIERALQMH